MDIPTLPHFGDMQDWRHQPMILARRRGEQILRKWLGSDVCQLVRCVDRLHLDLTAGYGVLGSDAFLR
jgi:hypothetical protein